MATQGTYYLDAPSLGSATVIYSDINLTTVAPDGFYSDGVISREQVSGALLPQVSCPSCGVPCGGSISASGGQGIYYLNTDLGTALGAIVVTFDPFGVPDGVKAEFNGIVYNALVSPAFGYLQGTANLATYIGDTAGNCGIPSGSPYTLTEYQYDGSSFISLGTTTPVTITSGQLELTAGAPGASVMVIPKTVASPSILALEFIGPCSGTAFNISVSCPAALGSFDSSTMNSSSTLACGDTIDQTYYVAHVNGSAGVLGLYDLVFSDANGEFKLAAGFYKTTDAGLNNWYQVDANGIIVSFGSCTGPYSYTIGFGGSPEDACAFIASSTVTGDAATFCSCANFTGSIFAAATTGTWYVSYGGDVIQVNVINGNPVASVSGACVNCV
jgi:hypothetical protein